MENIAATAQTDVEESTPDRVPSPTDKLNVARFEKLFSERKTIEESWDRIERFISPYRGQFFRQDTDEHQVEWKKREIYDSTALMAAQILAANMHGNLTSPSMRWFDMQFTDPKLRDDNASSRWLEESAMITYNAIQASNFNLEASELYTDLVAFGTGGMIEEEITNEAGDFEALSFTATPVKELYFEDDWRGRPQRFYRLMSWAPTRIVTKFGLSNVPHKIAEAYEKGDTTACEVIFAVWRRDDKPEDAFTTKLPAERAWGYNYYLRNGAIPLQAEEGGYYEMPAFIPRWRTSSGSRWGNSPAMVALPDVQTLNELIKMVLRSNEKVIDPAMFAEERALIGDLDLSPGGLNLVRRIGSVVPFESAARFDVSAMRIEDLRNSINRIFYLDQIQLKESPTMTATEVQVRYEMMQRTLGPTLGRLQSDYLNLIVERSFNILYRAGKLPEVPALVAESGVEAAINYIGPLARSQRVDASAAVERYLGQLMGMLQIDPSVRHVPNLKEMAIFSAESLNVPAKLINPRKTIDAKIKQDEQAQKEAQQAAVAEQGAKTDAMAAKAETERGAV